jgi:DNA mismatch repair ATPase MutS
MAFKSILFGETDYVPEPYPKEAEFFRDLNLDYVIEGIVKNKDKYNLKEFFFNPLHDRDTIIFRQEVLKDLEGNTELFEKVKSFAQVIFDAVSVVRRTIKVLSDSEQKNENYLEKGRFLDSLIIYFTNIEGFEESFRKFDLKSKGLREFREFLSSYVNSEEFKKILSDAKSLREELSKVKYSMLIKDSCIKVRPYEDEEDYTIEIEKIFEKFREGETKNYRKTFPEDPYAEHVEVGVLNLVSKLYPETFERLDNFYEENKHFVREELARFAREVQFYIAYLEYIEKFKKMGLKFTYPNVLTDAKEIYAYESFDIALADRLWVKDKKIVCNDFHLKDPERIIVVTGPNQGGKTTFARMFGQLHYLASLGLEVPGTKAQLKIPDRIFTHFEREENVETLYGKLQSDLLRMKEILDNATKDSIVIINEFLSSTSLRDAILIGKQILEILTKLDCFGVWVTFIDEFSSYSEKTVSMVSTVDPADPVKRTFKIVRKPSDGLAYAIHIAEKYGLTYEALKERIKS